MTKQTFVIVGASLAGATAAAQLRNDSLDGRILLGGVEAKPPHERAPRRGSNWPVGKVVALTGQSQTTIHGVPIEREAQVMLARWAVCAVLPRVTKKVDAEQLAAVRGRAQDARRVP